jgi:hypothetical protein
VNNNANAKHLSRWRDQKATYCAIIAGTLWSFRTCGRCEHFEPVFSACPYVGKTQSGASCDFWTEKEE